MSMTDTERELARFQGNVQRDSRRRVVLAAAASAVLLAGAVGAYLFLGEDRLTATPASGSPMTGSADLLLTQNTELGESEVTGQQEHRDAVWSGPMELSVDGRTVAGTLELTGGGGSIHSAVGPVVFHSAGTARATIGDADCVGAYGVSFYREAGDAGGSLHLACDDDTVLATTLAIETIEAEELTERWHLIASFEDGFYVE